VIHTAHERTSRHACYHAAVAKKYDDEKAAHARLVAKMKADYEKKVAEAKEDYDRFGR
jgi:hypothetical protein